jgi:hypothetical protein
MPVDIRTTDADGQHTHVVWSDARQEHLLFAVEGPTATSFAFDPKPWILWGSTSPTGFVEGPPKIVAMTPAPGAAPLLSDVAGIDIVFHKNVQADGTQVSLLGERSGPIPCYFAYDVTRHAVTLTPVDPLVSDTYWVTVLDTIIDPNTGLKLDGELEKVDGSAPLPSGDGVPGGTALARFYLLVHGDTNCDGHINFADINQFVLALQDPAEYAVENPFCPILNADCNGNGRLEFADINPFVALLAAH